MDKPLYSTPTPRRHFLGGLAKLPLVGGAAVLLGASAAPTKEEASPLDRARAAWADFSNAMDALTTDADGWRILGAANIRGNGYVAPSSFLKIAAVHLERDTRYPRLIVDRLQDIDLRQAPV